MSHAWRKKKRASFKKRGALISLIAKILELLLLSVFFAEFIDATFRINQTLRACIERVRKG